MRRGADALTRWYPPGPCDFADSPTFAQEEASFAVTAARRLMQLPGVGPATAIALVAMVGSGHEFKSGRQLSAWLGLDAHAPNTGSALGTADRCRQGRRRQPMGRTVGQARGKAIVAITAKNARMCWAVLQRREGFKLPT